MHLDTCVHVWVEFADKSLHVYIRRSPGKWHLALAPWPRTTRDESERAASAALPASDTAAACQHQSCWHSQSELMLPQTQLPGQSQMHE